MTCSGSSHLVIHEPPRSRLALCADETIAHGRHDLKKTKAFLFQLLYHLAKIGSILTLEVGASEGVARFSVVVFELQDAALIFERLGRRVLRSLSHEMRLQSLVSAEKSSK